MESAWKWREMAVRAVVEPPDEPADLDSLHDPANGFDSRPLVMGELRELSVKR